MIEFFWGNCASDYFGKANYLFSTLKELFLGYSKLKNFPAEHTIDQILGPVYLCASAIFNLLCRFDDILNVSGASDANSQVLCLIFINRISVEMSLIREFLEDKTILEYAEKQKQDGGIEVGHRLENLLNTLRKIHGVCENYLKKRVPSLTYLSATVLQKHGLFNKSQCVIEIVSVLNEDGMDNLLLQHKDDLKKGKKIILCKILDAAGWGIIGKNNTANLVCGLIDQNSDLGGYLNDEKKLGMCFLEGRKIALEKAIEYLGINAKPTIQFYDGHEEAQMVWECVRAEEEAVVSTRSNHSGLK